MKRYFHSIFLIMLFILAILVYKQWFSANAPVEYYPPIESVAPQHLESIEVMDFDGIDKSIKMSEANKTLIIAENFKRTSNSQLLLFNNLEYLYPKFNNKGIRTIHIWLTESDNIDFIKSNINPKEIDSRYILNHRLLAKNENQGLKINGLLIVAYDKEGQLIYERRGTKINYSKLSGEITEGVMSNK